MTSPGPRPARTNKSPARRAPAQELAREPRLEEATRQHYLDPLLYDREYWRRRADVNYYRALCGGRLEAVPGRPVSGGGEDGVGRRVLELGAGTGRLLVPLLRDGHQVTGVDLSEEMLGRCRDRLDRLPGSVSRRAELIEGDFRRLSLGRCYPVVLCPFNAMQHLYTRADIEAFLAVVRAHLAPGGWFCFDVLNPDLSWLVRRPDRRWARTRYKDPATGRPYYYSTNHLYDQVSQINWIHLYYDEIEQDGDLNPAAEAQKAGDPTPSRVTRGVSGPRVARISRSRVVPLAQRMYFPAELESLLHYNGFQLDSRSGGFVGEPFEPDSDSQVCRCSIRRGFRR